MRHFLSICLLLASWPCLADVIIPSDRLVNWGAYTGVEGGIPAVTTVYDDANLNGITDSLEAIDATGATVVRAAISAAISACPSNQAVVLPAGTFLIIGTAETTAITIANNGVVLRGQGPGVTKLVCQGAAGGFGTWVIQNGSHDYDFNSVTKYTVWNTSLPAGSSNISTTATHTFAANELVWIDQRTNTHYNFKQGIPDPCNFCSGANRDADQRVYGQISRVVSVSQNTNLVIEPPIAGMFQSTNSPQIMKVSPVVQKVGFESLTFSNTAAAAAAYMFHVVGGANLWWTNCEFSVSRRRFIQTVNTFRSTVAQCYFHHGLGSDWTDSYGPDRGYAMYLAYGTSFCRIEDNIFYHLHFAISHEGAITGNASYGNFHTNQIFNNRYTAQPSIGHHGGTATHNLWEHNQVNSMFSLDTYWGPGNAYTIFRNRAQNDASHDGTTVDQYAVSVDIWKLHRFHNIVGNVFGRLTSDTKVYIGNGDSMNEGGVRAVYRFGNLNANDTTYSGFDTLVTNTMVISNNYNYVTKGIPAIEQNTATLTNSYLYTSKPSWWGVSNWPSIGPDITHGTNDSIFLPAKARFYAMNGAGVTNWFDSGGGPGPDLDFTRGKPRLRPSIRLK